MDLINIESSNIRSYGYEPARKLLRIEFANGSRYDYTDVPQDVVEKFATAGSKGAFFGATIRGQFQCTRVEHPPIDKEPA